MFTYLRWADGRMAHAHVSWLDPHKIRRFTVVGSKRMAMFDDMEPSEKVQVYDKGVDTKGDDFVDFARAHTVRQGDIWIPKLDGAEPLSLECRHFTECVRSRATPLTDGRDGLTVVKVLAAAQASLEALGRARSGSIHWWKGRHRDGSQEQAGVDARVGAGTTWGEHCVFGANVVLGKNCRIGHHVVFHDDVVVGDDVRIDDHAVLGKLPMRAASSATTKDAQFSPLEVGSGSIVGTGVVLYRGAQARPQVPGRRLRDRARGSGRSATARSSAAA